MLLPRLVAMAACVLTITMFTGCGSSADTSTSDGPSVESAQASGHHHGAWWCNEHGVPEEVCALCDPKLVAEFKAKGDWCREHERPDSQCFACHPEREKEFASQYEAKYGKQPPKPQS